ncbi:MAG: (2Fe-2S)-binding protein [Cytophagales bacterium]|nr:(2Fe-2S)-binding protein [Cytophagales bacterium]
MAKINLTINNQSYKFEAEEDMPLLWAIRDYVGLKGTKYGCGIAQCGACTVHLDGVAVRSCQLPIGTLSKKQKITTIEGIGTPETLSAVQEAWVEEQVPQCGYCQSGQIMSAVAMLAENPNPTDEDIDAYMIGNLCRCGTYDRIRKAIHRAAGQTAEEDLGKR